MTDRVLRSNSDKTNLVPPLSNSKQQPEKLMMESNSATSTLSNTTDLQMIMQMLQKMQADANQGLQELKKEFKEDFTNRLAQVTTKVEHLASRIEEGESHYLQEVRNIQRQIDAMKLSPICDTEDTTPSEAMAPQIVHTKSYNLLRIALDKQIDELKPYFGKKQENIDSWTKKIDKLAEIAKMPDDEVFTLAKIKLQGDAERWLDNKKKEIDSWATLKSRLIDTFGSLGKTNKLELESLLHHRQQQLSEPATKYWNDMMSYCSTYDENMSTQDRVWRIFKGALPEFRNKYENKTFDDVDQLLKAMIQQEECRLRVSYEEQERPTQIATLVNGPRFGHSAVAPADQKYTDVHSRPANYQQRSFSDARHTDRQQTNSRSYNNNGRWNSNHPN